MAATSRAPVARGHNGHWLNAERVRVYSVMLVVIFALVGAWWVARSLPQFVDPSGKPLGCDFMGFWSAARLALAGRPEATYDWPAIHAVQQAALPLRPDMFFAWFHPPTFLLLMLPFGLLPYPVATVAFLLLTAALWALLVRRMLPDRRAWIVAAATPAGLINLAIGQTAFLTAGLAGFALLWLRRRPILSGVAIGLLAVTPHLAALFPLALLAAGCWITIASAAATLGVFVAASIAVFGWPVFALFFENLSVIEGLTDAGQTSLDKMPSALSFALLLGSPLWGARLLQAAVALVTAGLVWRAWRNRAAPFEAKAAIFAVGSLLVLPYSYYYDQLWAALAIGWLAVLGMKTGFRRFEREVLLFAWVAPLLMSPVARMSSVQLGFPAMLLLMAIAVRRTARLPERLDGGPVGGATVTP